MRNILVYNNQTGIAEKMKPLFSREGMETVAVEGRAVRLTPSEYKSLRLYTSATSGKRLRQIPGTQISQIPEGSLGKQL